MPPLLHASPYVIPPSWSPRSSESQNFNSTCLPPAAPQEWPTSPSPSPTSSTHTVLGRAVVGTAATNTVTGYMLYVPSNLQFQEHGGHCADSSWIHPSALEQQQQQQQQHQQQQQQQQHQQQQQSYLNFHLHHQISSYSTVPHAGLHHALHQSGEAVPPLEASEYVHEYHHASPVQSTTPEQHHHQQQHHPQTQMLHLQAVSQAGSTSPASIEYDNSPKEHPHIQVAYPEQGAEALSEVQSNDDRRYLTTMVDRHPHQHPHHHNNHNHNHNHHRPQNTEIVGEQPNAWTPLTSSPPSQTTAI